MNTELSSMGATYLCGLGLGLWNNIEDLIEIQRDKECYKSQINDEERNKLYQGWVNAIRSVLYLTDLNKK